MQDLGAEAGYTKLRAYPPNSARESKSFHTPERSASLERLIEMQILPRLLAARLDDRPPRTPIRARMQPDAGAVRSRAGGTRARRGFRICRRTASAGGLDDTTLMIEAFAPAARRLGAFWEQDVCDFLEVTDGLARLEAMLGELGRAHDLLIPIAAPALLLMTAPGETHFLGADIAAELFRREGWDVERAGPEGLDLIAARRFEAIAFQSVASVTCQVSSSS